MFSANPSLRTKRSPPIHTAVPQDFGIIDNTSDPSRVGSCEHSIVIKGGDANNRTEQEQPTAGYQLRCGVSLAQQLMTCFLTRRAQRTSANQDSKSVTHHVPSTGHSVCDDVPFFQGLWKSETLTSLASWTPHEQPPRRGGVLSPPRCVPGCLPACHFLHQHCSISSIHAIGEACVFSAFFSLLPCCCALVGGGWLSRIFGGGFIGFTPSRRLHVHQGTDCGKAMRCMPCGGNGQILLRARSPPSFVVPVADSRVF